MNLKCIDNATLELLNEIMPPKYYYWMELWEDSIKDIFVFIGTENDETVGTAVYITYHGESTTASCSYMMILEQYRNKGYGTCLLKETLKDLKMRGFSHIFAITTTGVNDCVKKMLSKCEMKVIDSDYNLGFMVGKLKAAGVAARLAESGAFGNVKTFDELSEISVRKYEKSKLVIGYNLHLNEFDKRWCRYFVIGGEILGMVLAATKDGETFYSVDVVIEPSEKTKMALPLMMFSLVNEIVETAGEEAGLIFGFDDAAHMDAMKKYFGEPEETIEIAYWELFI